MTLYEINEQIADILERMFDEVDEETGEVNLDLVEELTDLELERDTKLENVGAYVKNLESDIKALKEEIESLKRRLESKQKRAEYLKGLVAQDLLARGEKKKEFTKCVFSFRKSEQVVITNEAMIPKNLMRQTIKTEPDKVEIKNLIKVGHEVPGAELVEKQNIQIK